MKWKLDDKHFGPGSRPLCLFFSFAMLMSEIYATDRESVKAFFRWKFSWSCLWICRVWKLFVNQSSLKEKQAGPSRVEVEFSILRDYGRNKINYRVHHVWCLDPENTEDFFERTWDYQAKLQHFDLLHCFMLHVSDSQSMTNSLARKWRTSPSSCCLQGIRCPCAQRLPRFVLPPSSPLWGRHEPSTPVGRLRSSWCRGHRASFHVLPKSQHHWWTVFY